MRLAWSNLARQKMDALRRFSIERWGRAVALLYPEDIRDAAKRLAVTPQSARSLGSEMRIMRVRSRCLIVHVDEAADRLTVARVLHTAMDIERHLS